MTHALDAYFSVLRDVEGWSKTALSGAAAMQQVEAAILGPIQGWIIDHFGSCGIVQVGVVLFGAGLMLFGTAATLTGFKAFTFRLPIIAALSAWGSAFLLLLPN